MSDSKQACEVKGCKATDGVDRVRVSGATGNMDLFAYICPPHVKKLAEALKAFALDKPVPRPGYARKPDEAQESEMKAAEGREPRPHPKTAKRERKEV